MRPLVWFRADLRVADNPALDLACAVATRGVVGVFAMCPEQWREHGWAAVKADFVLRTLRELESSLGRLQIPLLLIRAMSFAEVPEALLAMARRHECDGLFFNREYEVNELRRDAHAERLFAHAGLAVQAFTDQVVLPPGALQTGSGGFYSVFTPFRRAWLARVAEAGLARPLGVPRGVERAAAMRSHAVPERMKEFECSISDAESLWPAGEQEAKRRLKRFLAQRADSYATSRDIPAADTTSRLSPYLSVGAISARQCIHAAMEANGDRLSGGNKGLETWITELIWREFYRHVLVGFPRVCMHWAFREETERVKWRTADADFAAWCEGRTGVPIVDAAMRQLNATGWMHNRLRMISATFLTKDLLIDWRRGERFFMQNLIDGDLASNNGGWQWSASTGTDAVPYFRIFNPWTQGKRFDPRGEFIWRFVPELRDLPANALHDPAQLAAHGAQARGYPKPIVDHKAARERAIAAFEAL